MNIPMNIILYCINQILINKLKPLDPKAKKAKKEAKNSTTVYENALYEAKVFHFIYSYKLFYLLHLNHFFYFLYNFQFYIQYYPRYEFFH